jgi:hypothetical protein
MFPDFEQQKNTLICSLRCGSMGINVNTWIEMSIFGHCNVIDPSKDSVWQWNAIIVLLVCAIDPASINGHVEVFN